jgi:hypothetical protein
MISSTGRSAGHLTNEVWIARKEFQITDPITTAGALKWNVDNAASIWVNGNLLVSSSGTWSSVTSTSVPAAWLHAGTNTIAIKVFQDGAANDWASNPTFFQATLTLP